MQVTPLHRLCCSSKFAMEWKNLVIVWFAGSIRGAIAFALVLSLGSEVGELTKTTVLGVVLFTTIAFGALMPAMKWMVDVKEEAPGETDRLRLVSKDGELALIDTSASGDGEERRGPRRSWFHRSWRTLDDGVIKRMLIKPSSLELREEVSPRSLYPVREMYPPPRSRMSSPSEEP